MVQLEQGAQICHDRRKASRRLLVQAFRTASWHMLLVQENPTSCESIASSNPRPSRKRKLPPKPQTSAIRMCRRFSIVEKCGDQVCASWVDGGAEGTLTVRGFEGRDPSSGVGDDQRHCVHEDLFLLIEPMPMLTLMQALSCLSLVEPSFSQP